MLPTISFNTNSIFWIIKILYISTNRKLPPKLAPSQLTISQYGPEFIFSLCFFFTKFSAFLNMIAFNFTLLLYPIFPLTLPSPHWGEGKFQNHFCEALLKKMITNVKVSNIICQILGDSRYC
jgi:hypothetical protein